MVQPSCVFRPPQSAGSSFCQCLGFPSRSTPERGCGGCSGFAHGPKREAVLCRELCKQSKTVQGTVLSKQGGEAGAEQRWLIR